MEVDTTKTKNFCETSVILDIDNVKNEAILRDFLQNSLCRNFIQFLSSHLTRCSEPTFRRSRASKHWKKKHYFATFLPFRIQFAYLDLLSTWLFLFRLFLFFACSRNCCFICPKAESLPSNLPSAILIIVMIVTMKTKSLSYTRYFSLSPVDAHNQWILVVFF